MKFPIMTESVAVEFLNTAMNQGSQINCPGRKEKNCITFKILRKYEIRIYTPLFTLKIGLFLWFAASSSAVTFLIVYLRQIGLTIQEIVVIHTITPTIQVLGSAALSVVVDKFGHSKLILICNLLLSGLSVICILLVPPLHTKSCQSQNITFSCHKENMTWMSENKVYTPSNIGNETESCEVISSNSFGYHCRNLSDSTCQLNKILHGTIVNGSEAPHHIQPDIKPCSPIALESKLKAIDNMCNNSWNDSCQMTCSVKNGCQEEPINRTLIIVIYNIILLVILATYMSIFRFFDITAVQLVKEHNLEYGLLRIWTSLGFLFGPLVAGLLVQISSESSTLPRYEAFMYFYAVLCLITALVVCKVDVRGYDHGRDMWKKSVILLRSPDIAIFFLILFLTGSSWGFDHTYKNWFLAEIGTEPYMFGIINSSQSVYALPFLLKSNWLVGKLGERNMFVMALVGYALKFLCYSFLRTAWTALLIEVITAFTYQLHWVAVIHFCIRITPVGLSATVNCVCGSIHYTIGRISGGFIGGLLLSTLDKRTAFQVMAGSNICVAFLYTVYLCFRKKKNSRRTIL